MAVMCDSSKPLQFYNQIGILECQSLKLILSAGELPHTTIDVRRNGHREPALIKNFEKTTLISDQQHAVIEMSSLIDEKIPLNLDEHDKKTLQYFVKHIQPFFEKTVLHCNPREGFDLLVESLSHLENVFIRAKGSYFGGQSPNLIDFGLFPYIDKIGSWMPSLRPTECPRLQAWVKIMRRHPVVAATALSPDESKDQLEEYSKVLRAR